MTTDGAVNQSQEVESKLLINDSHLMEPEQSQSPTSQPVVENQQLQIRRPPVRMTNDVPDQPIYYPGVSTNMHMVSAAPSLFFGLARHAIPAPGTACSMDFRLCLCIQVAANH